MTKRNITAIFAGVFFLLLPLLSILLNMATKNPIIMLNSFLSSFLPILYGLTGEFVYNFLVGAVLGIISQPKRYYIIPSVAFVAVLVQQVAYRSVRGDFSIVSALAVFLSITIFALLGYFVASKVVTYFRK